MLLLLLDGGITLGGYSSREENISCESSEEVMGAEVKDNVDDDYYYYH